MINRIYDSKALLSGLSKNQELYAKYDDSEELITWCGGCGNYQILNALKMALTLENIPQRDFIACFDVGCNGNGSDKMGAYTFHGLHGRSPSLAAGCKLGNPDLTVVASGGDGGTWSEGVGHIVHAIRSDYPMVFLHYNNSLYALTTGQPSATSRPGTPLNSAPDGVWIEPLNPVDIVLSLNPSFVARTFSGDLKHMVNMISLGLRHNGFAFIEILQVCPTYNKVTTQEWYWERVRYLEDLENYDHTSIENARKYALDLEKEIYLGLLYQRENNKSFLERIPNRQGLTTSPKDEVHHHDISNLLKEFQ